MSNLNEKKLHARVFVTVEISDKHFITTVRIFFYRNKSCIDSLSGKRLTQTVKTTVLLTFRDPQS